MASKPVTSRTNSRYYRDNKSGLFRMASSAKAARNMKRRRSNGGNGG